MRRLLLCVILFIGAVLTGLLLASLLLKQECPDCLGIARYYADHPNQFEDRPVGPDCRRCGDQGRVSLLNGRIGSALDPLMTRLIYRSNRTFWSADDTAARDLSTRLKASGLRKGTGKDWGSLERLTFERARFVHREGKTYVLMLLDQGGPPDTRSAWVILFDQSGMPVDAVSATVSGGASNPAASFVVPVAGDGRCAQVRLLLWKNNPCDGIEIDHAGKLWKGKPEDAREKLEHLDWNIHFVNGRLRILEGSTGKSIAE